MFDEIDEFILLKVEGGIFLPGGREARQLLRGESRSEFSFVGLQLHLAVAAVFGNGGVVGQRDERAAGFLAVGAEVGEGGF